ncbi:MAG TPA: neutral zinc metallopeptidase [Candidatus Limnocylindrales bacterium]|nr:neutral zinc metallopeptidase [Candidatus Limnocylindrales bacterium]
MRWSRGQVQDIEDRRASGGGGGFSMGGLGGGGGIPIPAGLGGGGAIIVVLIFLALQFFGGGGGGGLGSSLDGLGGQAVDPAATVDVNNNGDMVYFMNAVLKDANDLWADTFQRSGQQYQRAVLVLFSGATQSGCGPASSETGPFYCPADQKVYLDTDFFQELKDRFGAPGDFAQAYVIAHEIGHHVQKLTGIEGQVRQLQQQDPSRQNELSVKLELQADCLAGVWAQSVYKQGDLQSGDIEEGLNAASAVGDDRIQASAGVNVNPETWTHGSAAQRSQWFNTGFQSGDPAACDTFGS